MDQEKIVYKYAIDACTANLKYRITLYAETMEDALREYTKWAGERGIRQKDLWFADYFDHMENRRLAKLILNKDGILEIQPVNPAKEKVPYKRRVGFTKRLWLLYWNIKEAFDAAE